MEEDEELFFAEEEPEEDNNIIEGWKIILVDDDREVHNVTKIALSDFIFEGKKLVFLSAYSAKEAKALIEENSDTAMIFLDAIMETENAGLDVVKYIRDVLKNKCLRIILRTGQPGQISEDKVTFLYDINDYKTKTELTRQRLISTVITSLRSFVSLVELEKSKIELEKIANENYQLYKQLEEKVAERTKELKEKNQQLEQEIEERHLVEQELQKANRELERLASLDGLTQVANRRQFDRYLATEWRRGMRTRLPLSLILCDVDYFKQYNDTYGHQAGDDCLVEIARVISRAIKRAADLVARYGGEEFVIILPNTSIQGALHLAESIRESLKKLQLPHSQSQVSQWVTLSLGVSSLIPDRSTSKELLVAMADKALYEAKKQGRDRVCIAPLAV